MKPNTRFILLTYLLLCLCACSRKPYPQSLLTADSLTNIQPDSAIALLKLLKDSISTASKATQIYYQLLCIKANDKAYIRHTTDSLILPVLHYYIEKDDKRHLSEAYYYAGRVYRDLEDAPQALDYFNKALENISPEDTNYRLKSNIFSQMGTLFLYQKTFDEAIKMFKESQECDKVLKDSVGMVFNLRDIAYSHRSNNQFDSAFCYFRRSYDMAVFLGNATLKNMINSQMASLYVELKKYDLAKQALQPSLDSLDIRNKSGIYSIASELYHKTGHIDSAIYYYKKALICGTIYAKQAAHKGLAEIYTEKSTPSKALLHLQQYMECSDSIQRITDTETIRQLNSIYNYKLREKENNRLKAENEKKEKVIIYIFFVLSFVLITSVCYMQYSRQKRLQLKNRLDKLKVLEEEHHRKSAQFIEENKREIIELKQRLQESDQTNHELKLKLQEQIELTLCANKQAEIELNRRKQADTILSESEIYNYVQKQLKATQSNKKLLSDSHWIELEKVINETYMNFTENLRQFCTLNEHEYHVCLLIKIEVSPINIAKLTMRSKEAIASTRRRLYEKVFCKKGSPKDWDNFIHSL